MATMATLRLFASAREVAGTGHAEFQGSTVGDVLAAAAAEYGPRFTAVLTTCRVWLNGDPVDPQAAVRAGDEVAVLPPVSGGST